MIKHCKISMLYGWCGVFLSVITIFLYFNVPSSAHFELDSPLYEALAVSFAQTSHFTDPHVQGVPPSHPLGYPFFLGVLYKIFGHTHGIIIFAQLFLALLCMAVLSVVTYRLFGQYAAIITAVLLCTHVGFIVYIQYILADILLVTFLALFVERFVQFLRTGGSSVLAQAGFVLGLSLIVRPAGQFFIVPLVLLVVYSLWQHSLRSKVQALFALLISFFVPAIIYSFYNYYHFGMWGISPLAHENLFLYFIPRVMAHVEDISLADAVNRAHELLATEYGKSTLLWYVAQHPFTSVGLWLLNASKALLGLNSTQLKVLISSTLQGGDHSFFMCSGAPWYKAWQYVVGGTDLLVVKIIALSELGINIVRYGAAWYALCMLYAQRKYSILMLCVFYVSYFALITGHDGCGRYRMMLEPVLICLSAGGICGMYDASKKRYSKEKQCKEKES